MTSMQKDAVALIREFPDEQVAALLAIMRVMSREAREDKQDIGLGAKKGCVLGIAKGKFVCPDDIDEDNEMIARWFEGAE